MPFPLRKGGGAVFLPPLPSPRNLRHLHERKRESLLACRSELCAPSERWDVAGPPYTLRRSAQLRLDGLFYRLGSFLPLPHIAEPLHFPPLGRTSLWAKKPSSSLRNLCRFSSTRKFGNGDFEGSESSRSSHAIPVSLFEIVRDFKFQPRSLLSIIKKWGATGKTPVWRSLKGIESSAPMEALR